MFIPPKPVCAIALTSFVFPWMLCICVCVCVIVGTADANINCWLPDRSTSVTQTLSVRIQAVSRELLSICKFRCFKLCVFFFCLIINNIYMLCTTRFFKVIYQVEVQLYVYIKCIYIYDKTKIDLWPFLIAFVLH